MFNYENGVLPLVPGSTAKGVRIKIRRAISNWSYHIGSPFVPFSPNYAWWGAWINGENDGHYFGFNAEYIRVGDLKPGTVNADLLIKIQYK